MTIRQQGGVFGRHPSFSSVTADQIAISGSGSFGGSVSVNGNVVLASGSGVDFSATSGAGTSELFDDYEEGTWAPVFSDASSGGNEASTFASVGRYTKTGNVVNVFCNLVNIDTTGLTAGNSAFITGLPYVSGEVASSGYSVAPARLVNVAFSETVLATVLDATDYIEISQNSSGGANARLNVSDFTSGTSRIWFNLTYQV